MANAQVPDGNQYYIPHHSPWPILGSVALFTVMLGAISYLNDWFGGWVFIPGALLLAYHVLRLVLAWSSARASTAPTTCRSTAASAWG